MENEFPITVEQFISMVEKRGTLWDKSVDTYKNKNATQKAWLQILAFIYPNYRPWSVRKQQKCVKKLVKKWTYLRDSYLRSERKIERQKKFGSVNKISRRYIYHKQLLFLKKNADFDKAAKNLNQVYLTVEKLDDSSDEDSSDQSVETENQNIQIKIENDDEAEFVQIEEPQSQPRPSTPIQATSDLAQTDTNMIQLMTCQTQAAPINRHISFFNGLIPTLDKFDDDQVIEFQLGVLQLMKQVKNKIAQQPST